MLADYEHDKSDPLDRDAWDPLLAFVAEVEAERTGRRRGRLRCRCGLGWVVRGDPAEGLRLPYRAGLRSIAPLLSEKP